MVTEKFGVELCNEGFKHVICVRKDCTVLDTMASTFAAVFYHHFLVNEGRSMEQRKTVKVVFQEVKDWLEEQKKGNGGDKWNIAALFRQWSGLSKNKHKDPADFIPFVLLSKSDASGSGDAPHYVPLESRQEAEFRQKTQVFVDGDGNPMQFRWAPPIAWRVEMMDASETTVVDVDFNRWLYDAIPKMLDLVLRQHVRDVGVIHFWHESFVPAWDFVNVV